MKISSSFVGDGIFCNDIIVGSKSSIYFILALVYHIIFTYLHFFLLIIWRCHGKHLFLQLNNT